jgi:enoyl-CoA hydratase/carnithine racemase
MGATIEFDGQTAVVRMDWPDLRNSLDAPRAIELQEALTEAQNLDSCRALVLAGSPGSFCSGGDLRFFLNLAEESTDHLRNLIASVYQPLITAIVQSPVPVLAAVDGPAIGLGMDLALACDVCFVGPDGWLMQGWARAGLIPGAGGMFFLSQLLPKRDLWQLIVEQPRIDQQRAAELGLAVNCEQQSGEAASHAFVQRMIRMPSDAVTGYKRLVQGLAGGLAAHLEQAQALQAALLTSPAFAAGARKILDRTKETP